MCEFLFYSRMNQPCIYMYLLPFGLPFPSGHHSALSRVPWAIWYDLLVCARVHAVSQSCPTLCDPMDCSLPGSCIHGMLQARILEWVTISYSRGSSPPRDRTCVPYIAGVFFTAEPPGKPWKIRTLTTRAFVGLFHPGVSSSFSL